MHAGPEYEQLRANARQQKGLYGGARAAPTFGTPRDELDRLLKNPPLSINLDDLQSALEKAEAAGVSRDLLKKGLAKVEYAERVQTAARVKALVAEIDELLSADPLEVDVEALLEAIDFAVDKEGVPEGLIEKAEAKLEEAEAAQEAKRQELRAAATKEILELCAGPTMLLDAEKLAAATKEGEECDVAKETLDLAHKRTREAARREAAAANLGYLVTGTPMEIDVVQLRTSMKEATDAGVPMAQVRDAQFALRGAERAQVNTRTPSPRPRRAHAAPTHSSPALAPPWRDRPRG